METYIIYTVSSSPLLPEHQSHSHRECVEGLPVGAGSFDLCRQWHFLVAHEVVNDIAKLAGDICIGRVLCADCGQSFTRLCESALLDQPGGNC